MASNKRRPLPTTLPQASSTRERASSAENTMASDERTPLPTTLPKGEVIQKWVLVEGVMCGTCEQNLATAKTTECKRCMEKRRQAERRDAIQSQGLCQAAVQAPRRARGCFAKKPAMTGNTEGEKCTRARSDRVVRRRAVAREREKAQYEALKSQGLCTRCKKAPAASGIFQCQDCLERHKARRQNPKSKIRTSLLQQQQYKEAISKGLCTGCKRNPTQHGRVSCESCAYTSSYHKETRRLNRQATGKCVPSTSSHDDDGNSQDRDEPMLGERDSYDEDTIGVKLKPEVQETNEQWLLDTGSKSADHMAIDSILN
ncbi:hypothetical protein PG994_013349 [Apiospora phragmitis]|uniref:Stc1 domain-containing protein n=1 Tax=Apiospora phragmitis TaxID=2905665 RepID=A0ABR1T8E4_9PEZI